MQCNYFVKWLREVADNVEAGRSPEGRIQWRTSEVPSCIVVDAEVAFTALGGSLTIVDRTP